MKPQQRRTWLLAVMVMTFGCHAKQGNRATPQAKERGRGGAPSAPMPKGADLDREFGGSAEEPAPPSDAAPIAASEAVQADEKAAAGNRSPTAKAAPATVRQVHYDGELKLESHAGETIIAKVAAAVKAVGGYVETQTTTHAVLQVPVAHFAKLYQDTQKLGRVLSKHLAAEDITEAYSDAELRQKLMAATLKKLEQLLAGARNVSERLALLKEIGDLRLRLEEAAAELAALAKLAAYSRLTVDVTPPARTLGNATGTPVAALRWLNALTPDCRNPKIYRKLLELPVPDGFVKVKNQALFLVESASQAALTAATLANNPRGDSQFWADAVAHHLKERYQAVGTEDSGHFKIISWHLEGSEMARYDIAVYAKDDKLAVAQICYPTAEDEQRFRQKVVTALATYDGKGM